MNLYQVNFTFLEPNQGYILVLAATPEAAEEGALPYLQKQIQDPKIVSVNDKANENKETIQ